MDLIVKNARLSGLDALTDIGIAEGTIAAITLGITAEHTKTIDAEGRLVSPGLVEAHIHLDKSNLLSQCSQTGGGLDQAIAEVARLKRAFTPENVYERAKRTLERSILQGTMYMRTQLEIDPAVGLRSFEGVKQLLADYRWAVNGEICVFPQEGLLNYPGTEELLIEALQQGAHVLGAAPYTDADPRGQIDRIFEIARDFDVDIDMHLDFSHAPDELDLLYVCDVTEKYGYGGRVNIGHVTKLSAVPPELFDGCARRLADLGVALTVLPSTDLFLMGRHMTHNIMRGVTPAHRLLHHGVTCSLSTNNVLNPFTPFGDCSLIRMANLYANICHIEPGQDTKACFDMITALPAQLMNINRYGVAVGNPANLIILDADTPQQAVAELSPVAYAIKEGMVTVTRPAPQLHAPSQQTS